MDKETLPPVQDLEQKKDLISLIKQRKSVALILAGVSFFLLVLITVGIASWFILNKSTNKGIATSNGTLSSVPSTPTKVNPALTVTPTIVPLPKGPQIYAVSSKNAIAVKQLWINNLDTKIGDGQEMKLTIQDPTSPINSVTINLVTDHKKELHTLSLVSGSGKDGIWDGSWKTDDTHNVTYQAQITIKDQGGKVFSFTPSFR